MQITKIYKYMGHAQLSYDVTCILLDFSLTVKAGTLIFIYFYLFIQYLKRCTLLAEIAILPSGPL